jgi:hypothetical protein
MNPFQWRREHQVALLLAAIVGAALGFIIGYMHHNVRYEDATAFSLYLTAGSAFRWCVFGALIGGTVVYIRELMHVGGD